MRFAFWHGRRARHSSRVRGRRALGTRARAVVLITFIFPAAFQIMNRLAGARQAAPGETSSLPQSRVAWIRCSKAAETRAALPQAVITDGWERGLSQSNPRSEPGKVRRKQIRGPRLTLQSGLQMRWEAIQTDPVSSSRTHFPGPSPQGARRPGRSKVAPLPDRTGSRRPTPEKPVGGPAGAGRESKGPTDRLTPTSGCAIGGPGDAGSHCGCPGAGL